jgi:hypothetical protein
MVMVRGVGCVEMVFDVKVWKRVCQQYLWNSWNKRASINSIMSISREA